jgi:hypothetical protein
MSRKRNIRRLFYISSSLTLLGFLSLKFTGSTVSTQFNSIRLSRSEFYVNPVLGTLTVIFFFLSLAVMIIGEYKYSEK